MTWNPKIERLRPYVIAECRDIPPDLVMAIALHESGGTPGRLGGGHTKPGVLYDVQGNAHEYSVALGLMQTIPDTIASYNAGREGTKDFATLEDMTGDDERAIRLQLRIGCAYLGAANNLLHKRFPAVCPASSLAEADDDQLSLVLTGYAVGAGNTLKKMQSAQESNYSPTFSNLEKLFPNWGKNATGKWINRPLKFVAEVMQNFRANRKGSYSGSRPGDIVARTKDTISNHRGGFAALAIFLTAAGWAIQRYYRRRDED